LDETSRRRFFQNVILDVALSRYFEQARGLDIEVKACLTIPDELPVAAAELSTVFANALENAIHACSALP
jgi:hypothetical protein